jgi:hypothetical protein
MGWPWASPLPQLSIFLHSLFRLLLSLVPGHILRRYLYPHIRTHRHILRGRVHPLPAVRRRFSGRAAFNRCPLFFVASS